MFEILCKYSIMEDLCKWPSTISMQKTNYLSLRRDMVPPLLNYFLENKFYTFFLHEVLSRIPTKGFYVKHTDKTKHKKTYTYHSYYSGLA